MYMKQKNFWEGEVLVPPFAVPLFIITGLCLFFYAIRVLVSDSLELWFLNWNLVLAWVPLILSVLLIKSLKKNRWLSWQNLGLSFLWLLFLPNAFYLVTDFVHLDESDNLLFMLDTVLLMTYALTGLVLGWFSVFAVHRELRKRLQANTTYIILLIIFLLSSFAIYLGRNLGWNSWDLLTDPLGITLDILQRLTNPDKYSDTYSITGLLFIFITVIYWAFYSFIKAVSHKN